MILGLDVSTSRTGWAIITDEGEYVDSDFFKMKPKTPLEERATALEEQVLEPLFAKYIINEVRIEEPFSMFSGGKTTAKTMSSLQRFNGMVSLLAYQHLGKPPTMVGATTARSRCGIKVPRGTKAKARLLQRRKSQRRSTSARKKANPSPRRRAEPLMPTSRGS